VQVEGVSLVDGQRICTLLQGPVLAVNAWRQEPSADPALVSTLVEQPLQASESIGASWRIG